MYMCMFVCVCICVCVCMYVYYVLSSSSSSCMRMYMYVCMYVVVVVVVVGINVHLPSKDSVEDAPMSKDKQPQHIQQYLQVQRHGRGSRRCQAIYQRINGRRR